MKNIQELLRQALKGSNEAQKLLGDHYSGIAIQGLPGEQDEKAAVHWYKTAFLNKNKEALACLSDMEEKGSETAFSVLINIFLNGDMNGENRDLDRAFSLMMKFSAKNSSEEFSSSFIDSWKEIISPNPDFDKALDLARKITDNDKKSYALMFRPTEEKLFLPLPLNDYLQYTIEVEREMLKREGRSDKILAPETEGGWGYSEKEAIIIKADGIDGDAKSTFVIRCERPIAHKVLYRHALDLGLSNIRFEEEKQILMRGKEKKNYDVLEFHVSGIPRSLMPNMRAHFEAAQQDKDERAVEINMALHRIFLIVYHIKYWFLLP